MFRVFFLRQNNFLRAFFFSQVFFLIKKLVQNILANMHQHYVEDVSISRHILQCFDNGTISIVSLSLSPNKLGNNYYCDTLIYLCQRSRY